MVLVLRYISSRFIKKDGVFCMFSLLSRWLVVCSVLFCISGIASANAVSVYTLIDNGYKIVGTAGSSRNDLIMNALLQKRDSLFICLLAPGTSRCVPVPK